MTNAVDKFIAQTNLADWTIYGGYNLGQLVNSPAREIVDQYRAECTDSGPVIAAYGDAQVLNSLTNLLVSDLESEVEEVLNEAIDKLIDLAHDRACEALDAQVYDGDLQEFGSLADSPERIVEEENGEIGVWVHKNGGQTWCPLADAADYTDAVE